MDKITFYKGENIEDLSREELIEALREMSQMTERWFAKERALLDSIPSHMLPPRAFITGVKDR